MHSKPEACVFADGAYLTKMNKVFSGKLDYGKFFDEICEPDFFRKRTYYFDALPWKPHIEDTISLQECQNIYSL